MSVSPRILITGFEPFGGIELNPSGEIARTLDSAAIAGREVVGRVLPVEFGEAGRQLKAMIRELQPGLVLCLGVAASRQVISLERVAVNLDDARIPDNAGQQPIDQPVVPGAPTAYRTTLPVKAMLGGMEAAGIASELSSSAGHYVCNHLFYTLMHELEGREGVRGGFIHVPFAAPSGALEKLIAGIELGAKIALEIDFDVATPGGRID